MLRAWLCSTSPLLFAFFCFCLVLQTECQQAPPNDNCVNATIIEGLGTFDGTLLNATTDNFADWAEKPNVFYQFISIESLYYSVQLNGNSNLTLRKFYGCENWTKLLDCQPDSITNSCLLEFTGLKGDPFYLMVEGDGDYSFSIVIDGYSRPNNFCENATQIYPGQNISFVFDGPSIPSIITNCYSASTSDPKVSIFFKFSVEELAFFNFTTSVSVISGGCTSGSCVDVQDNEMFMYNQFFLEPGEYIMRKTGRRNSTSKFSLSLPAPPPDGYECETPYKLTQNETFIQGYTVSIPSEKSPPPCAMKNFYIYSNSEKRAVYYQFEAPGLFVLEPHECKTECRFSVQKGGMCDESDPFCFGSYVGYPFDRNHQPVLTYDEAILVSLKENETAQIVVETARKSYFSYYFHEIPANFECSEAEEIQDSTVIHASFNDVLWASGSTIDDCCYSYYFTAKEDSYVTWNVSSYTRFTMSTGEDCDHLTNISSDYFRTLLQENEKSFMKVCTSRHREDNDFIRPLSSRSFRLTFDVVARAPNVKCEEAQEVFIGTNYLTEDPAEIFEQELFFLFKAGLVDQYRFACNDGVSLNFCEGSCDSLVCEVDQPSYRERMMQEGEEIILQMVSSTTNLDSPLYIHHSPSPSPSPTPTPTPPPTPSPSPSPSPTPSPPPPSPHLSPLWISFIVVGGAIFVIGIGIGIYFLKWKRKVVSEELDLSGFSERTSKVSLLEGGDDDDDEYY